MHAADGPGEYEVDFSAVAGTAQGSLPAEKVAYIGTGGPPAAGRGRGGPGGGHRTAGNRIDRQAARAYCQGKIC